MTYDSAAQYRSAIQEAVLLGSPIQIINEMHEWHLRGAGGEYLVGTRGMIGFVIDGEVKAAYNHFDSYPGGLGLAALTYARLVADDLPGLADKVRAMRLVTEGTPVTPEDVERYGHLSDAGVGEAGSWYSLVRHAQGSLAAYVEAGLMLSCEDFPLDSLFCEWGYLLDLDANRLEAYEGFQHHPHKLGRFSTAEPVEPNGGSRDYYPIAMVASWPLDQLPTNEQFLNSLKDDDE